MKEGLRQSMAWLHTWAGLLFGWLLFAIFLTGTLSYFKEEISHWAQPETPVRALDSRASLAHAQQWLQANAAGASSWFINLPDERQPALEVSWRMPGATGRGGYQNAQLDPATGTPITARDSRGGEFFYRFHFELQMGPPWGRYLATLAAMVMLVTLVSGIITHKKIFKEFFTFRPRKGQRSWLDGHNALGVLILPFHLMITYSSLVIFMSLVMPASIAARYEGNVRAYYSDLFPGTAPVKPSGQAAPLVPLGELYDQWQQRRPDARISGASVQAPGDAAAQVTLRRHSGDQVALDRGSAMVFNGVSGQLIPTPLQDSVPVVIGAGFYGLHMGLFAQPWQRWLYFALGLGSTALIGTGLVMWLGKRQLKHARSGQQPFELRLVAVLNVASMAGLVLAIAGFLCANRLLPALMSGRAAWEVDTFFAVWALSLVHAALRPRQAWVEQLALAAVAFGLLPVFDLLFTDYGLWQAMQHGDWVLAGFDLTLLGSAAFLAWVVLKLRRSGGQPPLRVRAPQAVSVAEEVH